MTQENSEIVKNTAKAMVLSMVLYLLGVDEGSKALEKYDELVQDFEPVAEGEEILEPDVAKTMPVFFAIHIVVRLLTRHFREVLKNITVGRATDSIKLCSNMAAVFWGATRLKYPALVDRSQGLRSDKGRICLVAFKDPRSNEEAAKSQIMELLIKSM